MDSQKRHRLSASCRFYRSVESVKMRLVATWCWQTCWKLLKTSQSTCTKPIDNLQQTSYYQAGAGDAHSSWYQLDDSKATSLQQTCCNLRVSGCVFVILWTLKFLYVIRCLLFSGKEDWFDMPLLIFQLKIDLSDWNYTINSSTEDWQSSELRQNAQNAQTFTFVFCNRIQCTCCQGLCYVEQVTPVGKWGQRYHVPKMTGNLKT